MRMPQPTSGHGRGVWSAAAAGGAERDGGEVAGRRGHVSVVEMESAGRVSGRRRWMPVSRAARGGGSPELCGGAGGTTGGEEA